MTTASDMTRFAPIGIKSLDDLRKREAEIVKRIAGETNGGQLFLTDPFRLLREVGVEMDAAVEKAIRRIHPEIADPDDRIYETIRSAPAQKIRIAVEGLFRLPAKGDAK